MSGPGFDLGGEQRQRRLERFILGATIVASFGVHVGLIEGLGAAARHAPRRIWRPVELAVFKPPPPPPPTPEKKPEPPKPKEPIKIEELVETPPPPNVADETPPAEPPKPVFGISMSSVVGPGTGSSFTVRVGNTLMKAPEEELTPPDQVKPYGQPVSLHKVSTLPRPKRGQCEGDYPAEAKAMGIEGRVRLEVEVRADGTVGVVTVIKGVGHGLDEAAVAALKKCAFAPATIGDQAVATRIPYTYTFIIDE